MTYEVKVKIKVMEDLIHKTYRWKNIIALLMFVVVIYRVSEGMLIISYEVVPYDFKYRNCAIYKITFQIPEYLLAQPSKIRSSSHPCEAGDIFVTI